MFDYLIHFLFFFTFIKLSTDFFYLIKFDEFLSDEVGYPTLLSITMGLFVSPYGATSLSEYFANGFEFYFLKDPGYVSKISPKLYEKIENLVYN